MCGLSAVVDFGSGDGLVEMLESMHGPIPHRGPDGEGACVADLAGRCESARDPRALRGRLPQARAGLAFRWLQIQDRSPASAQPMSAQDGRIQLVFNGEIYNFATLRAELQGLGHAFHTASDTEVVLAAYRQWGAAMFARLDGMWAIVILDLRTRTLIASRDRFGIKPLFHARLGTRLLFASEVKQLLAAGVSPGANVPAVKRFIRGARPAEPEQAFFEAIRALPAASVLRVDLATDRGALAFEPYWSLDRCVPARRDSLEEACSQLDGVLAASVDEHLVSAVPMGILVSGGLDSSIVAAFSTRAFERRGERGAGYSMVLGPEHRRIDEAPHVRSVCERFGLSGFTAELTPAWLKSRLAAVARAQEEPVAGIAVAGQYLAYELAAAHGTRVVLDGQGSDELFGGYPRHQVSYLRDRLRRGAYAQSLVEGACLLARDPGFFRDLWKQSAMKRANGAAGLDFIRVPEDAARDGDAPATLDATLRRDVLSGNLRAVLAVTDRNAMAHSIEARVPYVARKVVEFAFSLPDAWKVGAGQRKRILRMVGALHLPQQIVRRRDRVGFGAPTREWLLGHFAPELRALPQGPAFASGATVDPPGLGRYLEGFLTGAHRDAGTVWRLYAIDQWARAYAVEGL